MRLIISILLTSIVLSTSTAYSDFISSPEDLSEANIKKLTKKDGIKICKDFEKIPFDDTDSCWLENYGYLYIGQIQDTTFVLLMKKDKGKWKIADHKKYETHAGGYSVEFADIIGSGRPQVILKLDKHMGTGLFSTDLVILAINGDLLKEVFEIELSDESTPQNTSYTLWNKNGSIAYFEESKGIFITTLYREVMEDEKSDSGIKVINTKPPVVEKYAWGEGKFVSKGTEGVPGELLENLIAGHYKAKEIDLDKDGINEKISIYPVGMHHSGITVTKLNDGVSEILFNETSNTANIDFQEIDGVPAIIMEQSDYVPDYATGDRYKEIYRWNGDKFVRAENK